MSKLKSLFQKAWTSVVNPGQDERVAVIVAAIGAQLKAKQSAFNLEETIRPIDCTTTDVKVASKAYYERLLAKYWDRGIPGEKHKKSLSFVASKLNLDPADTAKWNEAIAATYFGAHLADVLADGFVSDEELNFLTQIALFVDKPVKDFLQRHMHNEGVGFLRGVFAEATATGVLDAQLWTNLTQSAVRIGLSREELVTAVAPLARSFAEHVLADVKSDGQLTEKEEKYLSWLLDSFVLGREFELYMKQELAILRERAQISAGNLRAIPIPNGINAKAGEIAYFIEHGTLRIVKQLKSGPRCDDHNGYLLLTDSRLLFHSSTKPVNIPYRALVAWNARPDLVAVTIANKPQMNFFFATNHVLLPDKLHALIRMHSQLLSRRVEGIPERHIARDIRQRVWQRFGGKCADCGAMDYLEFDHIVPVAKGGSSSEQNVQLLCRRCNMKKSDKI